MKKRRKNMTLALDGAPLEELMIHFGPGLAKYRSGSKMLKNDSFTRSARRVVSPNGRCRATHRPDYKLLSNVDRHEDKIGVI